MLYSLFTLNDQGGVDEIITLDVVNSFSETHAAKVPSAAVETGYNVSDNMSLENSVFQISGVITDSKFRVRGHLVTYKNGEFVKDTNEAENQSPAQQQGIVSDKPSLVIRDRLLALRQEKQVFGILESEDASNLEMSRNRVIFPCVLTSIGFNKTDNSDAFYPTLSIQQIRVTDVKFSTVAKPTEELIPLAQSKLAGKNAQSTGGTGNTDQGTSSEAAKIEKQAKETEDKLKKLQNGDLDPAEAAKQAQAADRDRLIHMKNDYISARAEADSQLAENIKKYPRVDQQQAFRKATIDKIMREKYGVFWSAQLDR